MSKETVSRARGGRAAEKVASAEQAIPQAGDTQTGPASGLEPRPTKVALLQQMLSAPNGAALADLVRATSWQTHTVRAALTRLRQAGYAIERSKTPDGQTVYRIVASGTELTEASSAAGQADTDAGQSAPGEADAS